MRRLFFIVVVAALVWWVYGQWNPQQAQADPSSDGASGTIDGVLGESGAAVPPRTETQPLVAPAPAAAAGPEVPDIDALLARLQQRDATAIPAGWLVLAKGAGKDRERVLAALAPAGDDFAALAQALGSDNTFLHSKEGRELATKAAAAAMAQPDPAAVAAGTQLLGLMLRGRIAREDAVARHLVDEVYREHRVRVDRWLCDPANVSGARSYTVAKNDSLARIASRFRKQDIRVEDGTLAVLNRIHNPNALQVGQKIKVPVGPVSAVVEKRSFSCAIHVGDHLLRLYWVGHGEHDRTPVAEFTIGEKQPRPDWKAPDGNVYAYGDPKNILGEYWVQFLHESYTGFGAHGTPMPETICTMSSAGCIRMHAPDIAEVFKIMPRGAKVAIRATESLR